MRSRYCTAAECLGKPNTQSNLKFHRFPADPDRCQQWLKNCGRYDLLHYPSRYLHENRRLCSRHFHRGMFFNSRLVNNALPTIFKNMSVKSVCETVRKHTELLAGANLDHNYTRRVSEAANGNVPVPARQENTDEVQCESTVEYADHSYTTRYTSAGTSYIFVPQQEKIVPPERQLVVDHSYIDIVPPSSSKNRRGKQVVGEEEDDDKVEGKWWSLMDKGVQTPSTLCSNSPRIVQLKKKVKSAEATVKRLRKRRDRFEEQCARNEVWKNRMYLQPLKGGESSARTSAQADSSLGNSEQELENDALVGGSAVGGLSTDRYIRALAVCNDLAQLASQGSDAEFIDRVTMLMCLKKHWMDGRADAKVICGSGEAEDETVDLTALSLEVENISTESVLSQDSVTRSQPVIVLCSKNGTADRSAAENLHQQTEHYGIFPSLLTVPFAKTEDGMNNESGRRTVKNMKCNMCKRRFKTVLGLRMHKRLIHMVTKDTAESHEDVSKGRRKRGGNIKNTTSASTGDGSAPPRKEVFICASCGRQFKLRQSLIGHMVTHTGERPYACRAPGCTKRFGQSGTRNFHERTHSDSRPFLCTQCGRSFKQSAYLKVHREIMHSAEPQVHICPACGKQFRTPKALNLHVWNQHSDDHNQVCDVCSKQFKTRQQLARHRKAVHLRERPWRCTICSKAFSQPANLKSHMRVHTGEKPYLCSVCGRSFASSGSCRNHLLSHYPNLVLTTL